VACCVLQEDADAQQRKSRERADANPFRSLAEEVEEALKREARDRKEQGEGAGKEQEERNMDDAGGAQDADMYEYVQENEKSDAVAAGAATDEQRAQQMEEGEEMKDGEEDGEEGRGGDDDAGGDEGEGGKDGGEAGEEEEGEGEKGAEDKSWRFSKAAKPKAVAPADKEEEAAGEEEDKVEGGKEEEKSEEEQAARRREDAERQALLDGQEAIATNLGLLAQEKVWDRFRVEGGGWRVQGRG
jgi:hypothetical protein